MNLDSIQGLWVSQTRFLMSHHWVSWTKETEEIGKSKMLHNKELCNLKSLNSIMWTFKTEHVVLIGKRRNVCRKLMGNVIESTYMDNVGNMI